MTRSIYGAVVTVERGLIVSVVREDNVPDRIIMPGFIDSHVHIESSMVTPGAFALEAVRHGTVAVVTDPHEIANVMGIQGVRFMIDDSKKVPVRFIFGAPSCVPATGFESSGASISAHDIKELMKDDSVGFLSEVMNYPGVIGGDAGIISKIEAAKAAGKPVDGHAPGVTGEALKQYVGRGIETDHECTTPEEAREKISAGMKILIREGSAARNLDALQVLIDEHPEKVMLCCDDIHPDDLLIGHIDMHVRRLLKAGHNIFDVLLAACVNPVLHYRTGTGLLRPGDSADFIVADSIENLNILSTIIGGREVFSDGKVLFDYAGSRKINKFICTPVTNNSVATDVNGKRIRIIQVWDGLLNTGSLQKVVTLPAPDRFDTDSDILKIVVKERYTDAPPSVGFVTGFGIRSGAFASSVAHDSHNIIAVGTNDSDIVGAINRIIEMKGGLSWYNSGVELFLPLEIAGIISREPVAAVAGKYRQLTEAVRQAGSPLRAPFMTLSFMALLVIPELKIGDRGLFDVSSFSVVPLMAG